MSWAPVSAATILLSSFASQSAPWIAIQAQSEQRQPVYLGASPREMALGLARDSAGRAVLPQALRDLAERKLRTLSRKLGAPRFEVEAWPTQNDEGQRTWAFARWRRDARAPWQWISPERAPTTRAWGQSPETFLSVLYRPWIEAESKPLFEDFLAIDDLYAKPVFGDCVWSSENGMEVAGAWMPLESMNQVRAQALKSHLACRTLPQPARLDGRPFELIMSFENDAVSWPRNVSWDGAPDAALDPLPPRNPIRSWPADFEETYRQDVLTLAGEQEAVFPVSGKTMRFTRKNSADSSNQLLDVVSYLEERYAVLGIPTYRQEFAWRGIPQANLIAVVQGSAPDHASKPVLMADHYDTAFCEDEFARSHHRISAPGADDNDSATAALLRAAEIFSSMRPRRDIWLVHLTGEEFPGDDLGARHLVSQLLTHGQDISGLVLMDMIGWRKRGEGVFQISAGDSQASLSIARLALGSALQIAPADMVPVLRPRFDERSYLYNTDGLIFSEHGYPVILMNEHLNYLENLNRPGYHQTTDTSAKIDFGFASSIARIAIQTAATLSDAVRR
jgi:hypothetical protein